tara:strand:+ start:2769 stop:2942 length:174 start_codon:yes stop_codon:yes gene_type:complete
MNNYVVIISLLFFTTFAGCSKSTLEKIDLEKIKKETTEKKEDIEKIKEKIKKIKKNF